MKKSFVYIFITLSLLAALASSAYASDTTQAYFNDFDGTPIVTPGVTAALGGITDLEPVQEYDGYGFGGNFLRNGTGGYESGGIGTPGSPTTLTLTGLPPHTRIDINFLLAVIDSWDGSEPGVGEGACTDCHPDILVVTVDGTPIFSEAFGFNGPVFEPPSGVLLTEYTPLGFNPDFDDAAYDMGLNPAFDSIPHSASTLTIEWFASGDGWQGGGDESWAIEDLEILIDGGLEVDIDIKPGEDTNPINLNSKGVVPVAVLTTDDFDSSTIDPVSVLFAGAYPLRWVMEDVDLDGDMDYLFFFQNQELNLVENSTEATLTGSTSEGVSIISQDAIVITNLSAQDTPDWVQVNADGFGDPQNQQIPSLAVFGDYLYAGVWNAVWENGSVAYATAQIWRTFDSVSWELVNETEANGAAALIVYNGYLYSGSWSNADWGWAGKVWRSNDGLNWEFVTEDGFGNGNGIARFAVFQNTLYASTWSIGTEIWHTTSGDQWELFAEPGWDYQNNGGAIASEVFKGCLYWGVPNWISGAQLWRTDGVPLESITTSGFGTAENFAISSLAAFEGYLYAGLWNPQGVQIWRSPNGSDWEQISWIGSPSVGNTNNALEVYADQLYLVVQNDSTGLEVWRTANGIDWEQVGYAGFGDGNNQMSYWDNAVTVFKGNLYIATNNFATGGEVWKMCPTGCE
jgi:hypothetical protein